jgi:hypothetical protein
LFCRQHHGFDIAQRDRGEVIFVVRLEAIDDEARLQDLITEAVTTPSLAAFRQRLEPA